MKRVNAPFAVCRELIDAICNPACTVSCNDLYAGKLLFCQRPEKLLKNGLSMPVCGPYDGVGIMVDYDCNVFMSLAIARFINADIY